MHLRKIAGALLALLDLCGCASTPPTPILTPTPSSGPPSANSLHVEPLSIGESFNLTSAILGEERRINVFAPTIYGRKIEQPLPVLYMPDGGIDEDFLHIAGLVQVLVCNGGMRAHLLVGIQNTQRRRDMTAPTQNSEDRKIAPVVGGSAAFRRFIREELKPAIRSHYRITDSSAIVGESLAGLFVVETLFREPDLFDTYIAIDPSLWWNNNALVAEGESGPLALIDQPLAKCLFVSFSSEPKIAALAKRLALSLHKRVSSRAPVRLREFITESHATIYHPAAITSFREAFAPPPGE